MRPTVLSLFSGCGGLDLGLEAAGFDIKTAVDIDPIHIITHKYNFPDSNSFCADIKDITSEKLPNVDLVAGGSPCQGFSHMGKRDPNDKRNHLIFEFARIVLEIKPKYFLFENVPALLHERNLFWFNEFIKRLKTGGYRIIEPKIINAINFATPQKRKRLFLIGYYKNCLPVKYPKNWNAKDKGISVKNAIEDLAEINPYYNYDLGIEGETLGVEYAAEAAAFPPTNKLVYLGWRENLSPLQIGYYKNCHRREINRIVYGHLATVHSQEVSDRFKNTEPGKREPMSRFYRLHPQKGANSLRAGTPAKKASFSAPKPIHYLFPRCITIREAARIHGYPDWFRFNHSSFHAHRQIGNSVCPLVALALGRCFPIVDENPTINDLKPISDAILEFSNLEAAKYWGVSSKINGMRTKKRWID